MVELSPPWAGDTVLQLPQRATQCQGREGRQQGPRTQVDQGHIPALSLPTLCGSGCVSEPL